MHEILNYGNNELAEDFLNKRTNLDSYNIGRKMLKYFKLKHEPFLYQYLISATTQLLTSIKVKHKLFIKESALLKGIVDEYNVLKENEVFIQIEDNE